MRLLLDTCILAELRHPQGSDAIKSTVSYYDDDALFLSVLTVGEIAKGINLLPESKKKLELANWLRSLEQQFYDRILPIDRETAIMWGELTARAQNDGITIPACDGLIAATALRYGLHVVTKNIKHFKGTGALILEL